MRIIFLRHREGHPFITAINTCMPRDHSSAILSFQKCKWSNFIVGLDGKAFQLFFSEEGGAYVNSSVERTLHDSI